METAIKIGNEIDLEKVDGLADAIVKVLTAAGENRTDEVTTRRALDVLVAHVVPVPGATIQDCTFTSGSEFVGAIDDPGADGDCDGTPFLLT